MLITVSNASPRPILTPARHLREGRGRTLIDVHPPLVPTPLSQFLAGA
jgi:hypothetical protein